MAVSSYGNSTRTSGVVRIVKDLDIDLAGRDVLVVEDIIDSGLTLKYLGSTRLELQQGEGAERDYREALAILERHGEAGRVRSMLLAMLIKRGRFEDAAPVAREMLASARQEGDTMATIVMLRQPRTELINATSSHPSVAATMDRTSR